MPANKHIVVHMHNMRGVKPFNKRIMLKMCNEIHFTDILTDKLTDCNITKALFNSFHA